MVAGRTGRFVTGQELIIEIPHLQHLIEAMQGGGYRVIGPVVRDGAIVYEELASALDLPAGWTDRQDGGAYRLSRRSDKAVFGYGTTSHSWKKFLLPPHARLWQASREPDGLHIAAESDADFRSAFFGVRPCDLHAIEILDRVFADRLQQALGGPYRPEAFVDTVYRDRRENSFLVAVNCTHPGTTCFCVSMKTGPRALSGFDLALTEVLTADHHYFVAQVGTAAGAQVLEGLSCRSAAAAEKAAALQVVAAAAKKMGRSLDTSDIKQLLYRNHDNPRWKNVAARCLACANCTMVCPTCFCCSVADSSNLAGSVAERRRHWDSCFTMDFSYIHGGNVRSSPDSRYRQWLTHKLATWIDQFGVSGCVGCGRCITWCPVAIDITEEVRAIREIDRSRETSLETKGKCDARL